TSAPGVSADSAENTGSQSVLPPAVQVRILAAAPVSRKLHLMGVTQPKRFVQLRAQTAGAVVVVHSDKGEMLKAGDLVIRIDIRDRKARQRQAKALVAQRLAEYRAASELSKKKLSSKTMVAKAQALLEAAKASLQSIELDMRHTRVTAPFAGIIERRFVEIGDYLDVGDPVADLLDLSEVVISGQASERDIGQLRTGMPAQLTLSGGQRLTGTVTFIAHASDSATRTFRVEVTASNKDVAVASGMTAKISLNLGTTPGHLLTPAVLTLDDEGRVGVKIIDSSSRVRFLPVDLILDTPDGMWLGGLPDTIELITVGHEFVSAGQQVTVSRNLQ
ncbi:MAG: efflux RND transporter periplasmic adaptor subunit, partial [Arenicellales bacterium]|nr:efflux RND transporter periplasmic adaptor subunit [Arenicellales bacterium]